MSYFCGAISMILFVTLILIIMPSEERDFKFKKLFATFPAFRFPLVIVFILAATGIAIRIFKKYKVNYLFIFELDPGYKITHV
jgi:uncharacterized integral membrane protein